MKGGPKVTCRLVTSPTLLRPVRAGLCTSFTGAIHSDQAMRVLERNADSRTVPCQQRRGFVDKSVHLFCLEFSRIPLTPSVEFGVPNGSQTGFAKDDGSAMDELGSKQIPGIAHIRCNPYRLWH